MNITIIGVGKIKEKYLKLGIDEFSKRLTKYCKLDVIELDDEKITEEYLDSFESVFYPLDEEDDRIKSMAGDYCRLRAKFGQCFIEGYGHVLERGKVPLSAKLNNDKPNDAINILDYYGDDDIEVYEL